MIRLIIAIALCLFGVSVHASITLSLEPNTHSVLNGSTTTIDILISGLPGGVTGSVGAFDIDLAFDPAQLTFQSAAFGNQLDIFDLGDIQTVSRPNANLVNLFELSLESATDLAIHQVSSFRLGTLTFLASGIGNSALSLSLNALSDANGGSLSATLVPGNITVTPVPEPGTFVLALLGLAGIIAGAVRRART